MCFYKDYYYKHRNVKTAGKNIPCFKVLENTSDGYISPYFAELYFNNSDCNSNTVKKAKFIKNHTKKIILCDGLHTYSSKYEARKSLRYSCTRDVFKSYIPKGTKYYYNHVAHEYISEKLFILNHHTNNNKI